MTPTISDNIRIRIRTLSKEKLLLLGIIILAFFLRIYKLSLAEFKNDEAFWCQQAKKMIETGEIPLRGQHAGATNITIYLGPFLTYLTALSFLIFGESVKSGIYMVVFLNTATVYLTYKTGKELYDTSTGLIAAFLLAISPWMVIYSRKIWPQDLLPFFLSLMILTTYKIVTTTATTTTTTMKDLKNPQEKMKKEWYTVILGVSIGLSIQLHLTALILPLLALILFYIYKVPLKQYIILILSILLALSPLLIHDFFHGFQNIKAYFSIALDPNARPKEENYFTHLSNTLWFYYSIVGGRGLEDKIGNFYWKNSSFLKYFAIEPWIVLIFLLSNIALIVQTIKKKKPLASLPKNDIMITFWIGIPLILLLLTQGEIYIHYFIILSPAYTIATATTLTKLTKKMKQKTKNSYNKNSNIKSKTWKKATMKVFKKNPWTLSILIICTITAIQIATLSQFFAYVEDTGGQNEYGSTLESKQAAINYVKNDIPENYTVDISGTGDAKQAYIFLLQKACINYYTEEEEQTGENYQIWYYILEIKYFPDKRVHQIIQTLEESPNTLDKKDFKSVIVYKTNIRI
ncbi:MAG: ArnT family glycosyltransferase [Candidatus Wukongarchaeota archaeon]|nr:glycosyltransferase family 39 protein [Candidatus Wukongarchaeota archaeon]